MLAATHRRNSWLEYRGPTPTVKYKTEWARPKSRLGGGCVMAGVVSFVVLWVVIALFQVGDYYESGATMIGSRVCPVLFGG